MGTSELMLASCYGNWDKLRPDGPLGSYAYLPTSSFSTLENCIQILKVNLYIGKMIITLFYFQD